MTTDLEQLRQVISGLSSKEKQLREGSETSIKVQWKSRPDVFIMGLVGIISTDPQPTNRSMAAVIMRRTIGEFVTNPVATKKDSSSLVKYWHTVSSDVQRQSSLTLLEVWSREAQVDVRNKIGDLIAEIARGVLTYSGTWPELTSHLLQIATQSIGASNFSGIMAVLRVIGAVPECITASSTSTPDQATLSSMGQILGRIILLPGGTVEAAQVKVAALKALHSLISAASDEVKLGLGKHLVVKLPEMIVWLAQHGPAAEDDLREALQTLIAMIEDCPKLYRSIAPTFANVMVEIIRQPMNATDNAESKALAIEVITSLIEQLPNLFKKSAANTLGPLISLLVEAAGWGLVSEEEWTQSSPDDEIEEEALSLSAEQALDRIAIALGSHALLPTLLSLIPSLLRSPEWHKRYAALRAIANIAEGCADSLEDRLGEVLSLVWPAFQDPHPRVQYAACHALGQLCTDFSGTLQESFAVPCLNNLVGLLSSSSHSRVQCHAAAALINFAEGVEADTVAPILEPLLARLVNLLGSNVLYLQEQVLATLAAFSTAAGKAFIPFLSSIMPILMNALQNSPRTSADDNFRLLQCRALEAATMAAVAVGKEAFAPFTKSIVDVMVTLQRMELDDADQMVEYLASAWVRICQLLEAEFAPFVPLILPQILETAAAEPDVAVIQDEDEEEEYDPNEWEFATIKGRRLGIHTATLDAKCLAVENLAVYIGAMGVAFVPHVPSTYSTLLPLLAFNMHEGVQIAAASAIANLIKYQLGLDATAATSMSQKALEEILKEITKTEDAEVQVAMLDAIADILNLEERKNLDIFPQGFLSQTFKVINGLITILVKRQTIKSNATDEDEAEEEETTDEDDEAVMYGISRLSAAVFKAFRESSMAYSETLLQFVFKTINTGRPPLFKHAAVCILDDFVHWMGQQVMPIKDHITQCFARALDDPEDNDVRQAAIFGIGMCSEHAPGLFSQFCIDMTSKLLQLIQSPNSKAPSQLSITDNAMSAVVRILQAFPGQIQLEQVIPCWIRGLPVSHDEEEAPIVYRWLLSLLHSHPDLVLGPQRQQQAFIANAIQVAVNHQGLLPEDLLLQAKAELNSLTP